MAHPIRVALGSFAIPRVLAIGLWAAFLVACGSPVPAAGTSLATSPSISPMPTASVASPAPRPDPPPPGAPPGGDAAVDCPAVISSANGSYSFICPLGWKALHCEALAFTWLLNPGNCRGEAYGARFLVLTRSGDHSQDPPGQNGLYTGEFQSSQSAKADGRSGTRSIFLVKGNKPLPPSDGTIQIQYIFFTGGRTYWIEYDRYPGDSDLTAAFDSGVALLK